MPNTRRQIILNEIQYWKQNKLLPDQYCDFLSTLYTEGEVTELEKEEPKTKKAVLAAEKRKHAASFGGMLTATLAVLYALFTAGQWLWLIAATIGVAAISIFIGAIKLAKSQSLFAPMLHVIAALLFLGLSLKLSLFYFADNNIILYILLLGNCLLWLLTGVKMKLYYFTVSGVLGILGIVGFIVYRLL